MRRVLLWSNNGLTLVSKIATLIVSLLVTDYISRSSSSNSNSSASADKKISTSIDSKLHLSISLLLNYNDEITEYLLEALERIKQLEKIIYN